MACSDLQTSEHPLWNTDWKGGKNRSQKTSWEALVVIQVKDNHSLN